MARMTNTLPITVLGGTGKIGRRVVHLLERRSRPVRVASRSSATRFDWHDPATWAPAVAGSATLFIVPLFGRDQGTQVAGLVEAAKSSGSPRLVLMTGSAGDLPTASLPAYARAERDAEDAVRRSGLPWAILRPNWFMQNFDEDFFLEGVLRGELLLTEGDGALPFVDADDVAAAAVELITNPAHNGAAVDVSGPAALTFQQAADRIGAALGRTITCERFPRDAYVGGLVEQGLPLPLAEDYADLFATATGGHYSRVAGGIEDLLHRPPRAFEDYARRAAAAGAWSAARQPAAR